MVAAHVYFFLNHFPVFSIWHGVNKIQTQLGVPKPVPLAFCNLKEIYLTPHLSLDSFSSEKKKLFSPNIQGFF